VLFTKGLSPAVPNTGEGALTEIVPPMLSPPTLTGRNSGKHLDAANIGRIYVRKRRIHVVRTGRNQIHTIHFNTHPVICHPMNCGQTGYAAIAVKTNPGLTFKHLCGIAAEFAR